MGETISFQHPNGQWGKGYLAAPPRGDRAPAVIVLHEWWGLTDPIREIADRLATAGYRALAVDLYGGAVAATPLEGMRLLKSFDFDAAAAEDTRGALRHMKASGGRAAVLGFSLGGAVALLSAIRVPECDAAISFYGIPLDPRVNLGDVRVPVQSHLAQVDEWYKPAVMDRLEASLSGAAVRCEVHRYGARHGFSSSASAEIRDPVASATAWRRSLDFLARSLSP
jgi:carboxymethylenebutenolidase